MSVNNCTWCGQWRKTVFSFFAFLIAVPVTLHSWCLVYDGDTFVIQLLTVQQLAISAALIYKYSLNVILTRSATTTVRRWYNTLFSYRTLEPQWPHAIDYTTNFRHGRLAGCRLSRSGRGGSFSAYLSQRLSSWTLDGTPRHFASLSIWRGRYDINRRAPGPPAVRLECGESQRRSRRWRRAPFATLRHDESTPSSSSHPSARSTAFARSAPGALRFVASQIVRLHRWAHYVQVQRRDTSNIVDPASDMLPSRRATVTSFAKHRSALPTVTIAMTTDVLSTIHPVSDRAARR